MLGKDLFLNYICIYSYSRKPNKNRLMNAIISLIISILLLSANLFHGGEDYNKISKTAGAKIDSLNNEIALARRMILSYQEELVFFNKQEAHLKADTTMHNALARAQENINELNSYIENEENRIIQLRSLITGIKNNSTDLKAGQPEISVPATRLTSLQELESELAELKTKKELINRKIYLIEHLLDSLERKNTEAKPLKRKKIKEKELTGQETEPANRLMLIADKSADTKQELTEEQLDKAIGSSNRSGNEGNVSFGRFIAILSIVVVVLIVLLYFLGRSNRNTKANQNE